MLDSLEAVRASILTRRVARLTLVKAFVEAVFAYLAHFAERRAHDTQRVIQRVQGALMAVAVENLVTILVLPDPALADQRDQGSVILARHAGQQAVDTIMQVARTAALQNIGTWLVRIVQQLWITPTLQLTRARARWSAALVRIGGKEALEAVMSILVPPGETDSAARAD